MRRGWFGQSYRHYLAAKGVRTRYFAEHKDPGLYVLNLRDGKKYVGISTDVGRRIREHRDLGSKKRAEWVKRHYTIGVDKVEKMPYEDAKHMEPVVTQNEMMRHGLGNVRGAHYTAVDLPEDLIRERVSSSIGSIEDRQDAMHEALERFAPEHAEHYPNIKDKFFANKMSGKVYKGNKQRSER